MICIYRFLQQKKQFAAVDHELFTLLAGHAATAIFCLEAVHGVEAQAEHDPGIHRPDDLLRDRIGLHG